MKKITGLDAAILLTAPSMRAASSAIPGVGRTRVRLIREQGVEILEDLFSEEESVRERLTGRSKRGAPSPQRVALDLAEASWRLAKIKQHLKVESRSRHIVPNSYRWGAEGVVLSASLEWTPGSIPRGSISYRRERVRSIKGGTGWAYRVSCEVEEAAALAAALNAEKYGGTIIFQERN